MPATPVFIGDNPQRPAISDFIYNPDQLIAGGLQIVSSNGVLLAGTSGQIRQRGTVLGQLSIGGATSAAKSGGNTGNGTLVVDVANPVQANAIVGVYAVRAITVALNAATFRVTDPQGDVVGDVSFSGSGASGTFNGPIKFAITDGGTDFIAGDGFDVTVAAGTGKYVPCVRTAVNGSAVPVAILADDVDITADAVAGVYLTGEFNGRALVFDASWTLAALTAALRTQNIYVKSVVSASEPT